ncbi:MAG: LCP family protein [bacterium]|nr:LCP family protein [bacterium]
MTNSAPPPDPLVRARVRRRTARWLQLLGLVVALTGLTGFWVNRDVARAELTELQREILGVQEGDLLVSFVLAGRDRMYFQDMSTPVYGADGGIVAWNYRGPRSADGTNTDTILYVSIVNDDVTLVAIPRDLYLDAWQTRINAVYYYQGAEGLRRTVEEVLGLPVDYYAVINLDVFQHVVDALGGVEVNVPYRMRYVDVAGGLDIDLQPGPQTLDGQRAGDFVRYRETVRGDFDRIDRVKTLAFAMLTRVRQLNVRAVTVLPDLVETVLADVETNASPALLRDLLPRLGRLQIRSATLPTYEFEGSGLLYTDRRQVEDFLAATFGGTPRDWSEPPEVLLHVVDRSGRDGLGEAYLERLVAVGVPSERLLLTRTSLDPAESRLVATAPHWEDADYYAALVGVGKQQIDRLPAVSGQPVGLQLILGQGAPDPSPSQERLAQLDVVAFSSPPVAP